MKQKFVSAGLATGGVQILMSFLQRDGMHRKLLN
jgi:hypothetical protein